MAKKNAKAAAEKASKEVTAKKKKKVLTPAEKAAKMAKLKERLANRPAGQRTNSKQIDVIELDGGSRILSFGMPVRTFGTVITTVAVDAEGNVTSVATTTLAGVSPKVKKGHGTLVPKVPGLGKAAKVGDMVDADEEDEEDDE